MHIFIQANNASSLHLSNKNVHHYLQKCNIAVPQKQWTMLFNLKGTGCAVLKPYRHESKAEFAGGL